MYILVFLACAPLPCLYDLSMNNDVWQELKLSSVINNSVYLFGAYLDNRVTNEPAIRVLVAADQEIGI